jgi:hypothetical protein
MVLKYTIAWVPMVFIAIANGVIRQFGYGRFLSELHAHQVSCATGITLFYLYTWLLSLRWPLQSSGQAFGVGLIWLGLTIAFEFVFGHYVMKHPWTRLLHDYDISKGRLWSLVLVAILLSPFIVFRTGN